MLYLHVGDTGSHTYLMPSISPIYTKLFLKHWRMTINSFISFKFFFFFTSITCVPRPKRPKIFWKMNNRLSIFFLHEEWGEFKFRQWGCQIRNSFIYEPESFVRLASEWAKIGGLRELEEHEVGAVTCWRGCLRPEMKVIYSATFGGKYEWNTLSVEMKTRLL